MTIEGKLESTYSKVVDMLKYSEAKNISIIAVNSAIFVLYTTIFKIIFPNGNQIFILGIWKWVYIISVLFLFLSSIMSLSAIVPRYVRNKKYIEHEINYIFYADLKLSSVEKIESIYNEYEENNKYYVSDLSKSIFAISKIAVSKNNKFICAVFFLFLSAVLFVICYFKAIGEF